MWELDSTTLEPYFVHLYDSLAMTLLNPCFPTIIGSFCVFKFYYKMQLSDVLYECVRYSSKGLKVVFGKALLLF